MATRLVILGLLRDGPLHGYEIKQIVEEHMGDWASLAFGSIYFALGKLTEEGFVERVGTDRQGSRPSRIIYQITDSGRSEFERLLRQVWAEVERTRFPLDVALFFLEALPAREVRGYLRHRVEYLTRAVDHVEDHRRQTLQQEEVPRVARAIFDHTLVHTRAELEWTRDLLEELEKGGNP